MNVIIYVIDALRADHISCYGYPRETTPNIDKIAEEGLLYTQCFSPSTWTKAASASILSGAYPPTHGARLRSDLFTDDIKRLPEILSDAGFDTGAFSAIGNVSSTLGYDRGFDHYNDIYLDPDVIARRNQSTPESEKLVHEDADCIALPKAEDVNAALLDWLNDHEENKPFFAFSWVIDPHMPYDPPAKYKFDTIGGYDSIVDGTYKNIPSWHQMEDSDLWKLKDLYDSEVAYCDAQIGSLVGELQERNEYDETMLIIVGDHGEGFMDHNELHHASVPYDEQIRVPCVVKPPASINMRTKQFDDLISLIDLFPTVAEIAGIPRSDLPPTIQGKQMPPFGNPTSDRKVYSETQLRKEKPRYRSIRTKEWKIIAVERPDISTGEPQSVKGDLFESVRNVLRDPAILISIIHDPEIIIDWMNRRPLDDQLLFHLPHDPHERRNLVENCQDTATVLENDLKAIEAECDCLRTGYVSIGDKGNITSKTEAQLKLLGYVD